MWTVAIVAATMTILFTCDITFLGAGGWVAYYRIKLPRGHDASLLGTWKGTWRVMDEQTIQSRVTVFRADGTGQWSDNARFRMPFDWGTEEGVLYTRRMATDAWSGRRHRYRFSSDKNGVHFDGQRMFDLVSSDMRRQ